MNTFWNVLWIFPFCGWLVAILYGFLGLCMCATVVGLPIGLGLLQYSKFLFWPHGNAMISKSDLEVVTERQRPLAWQIFAGIVRVIYFPFGLLNAIGGVIYGFACFLTIIGIPEGLVVMKSIGTLFNPVNKVVVPEALRDEIERRKALKRYSPAGAQNFASQPVAAVSDSESGSPSNATAAIFCTKCGCRLPVDAAFCPKCGQKAEYPAQDKHQEPLTEMVKVRSATQMPVEEEEMTDMPVDDFPMDREMDNRQKILLFGGIGVAVIAIVLGIWAIFGGSGKLEPDANVFVDNTVIFKNVEDGIGIGALKSVGYGTEVECKASEFDEEGIWTKVAFDNDGKVTTGYIAKRDILDSEDFNTLHKAGMSDTDVRSQIYSKIMHRAILDALRNNGSDWRIDILTQVGENRPNSKILTVRGAQPSENCLGFILRNYKSNEREFFLYSLPDFAMADSLAFPVFLHREPVKGGKLIYDVIYNKKRDRYNVKYETNTAYNESASYPYEDSAKEEDVVTPAGKVWNGRIVLNGHVDGKYPVKMEFTMHDGGMVSGTVTYLKYNIPMELSGHFTDAGDCRDLLLNEQLDGKVTGIFSGRYDGMVFSGSWSSPDGAKEMSFKAER